MYEIFVVAALFTALLICIWYSRALQGREGSPEEVPDGGENIATRSQVNHLSTSTSISEEPKLEIPEPAIEIEVESVQEAAPTEPAESTTAKESIVVADQPSLPEPVISSVQATEPIAPVEQPAVVEPAIQVVAAQPAVVEPAVEQPAEQPAIAEVQAIAQIPVPEPVSLEASSAPLDTAPPIELDDQKLKIIDILSADNAPKTVREIAQAYYGKGSYNKRKDSRIRRILAEMTRGGLLIETSIANSRAFEIKKAA